MRIVARALAQAPRTWLLALALCGAAACSSAESATESGTADPDAGTSSRTDAGNVKTDGGASPSDASAIDSAVDSGPPPVTDGVLVGGPGALPGAIAGIDYVAGDQSGTTDANGRFRFRAGDSITFRIAGVELATLPAKATMSPFSLAGGACAVSDAVRRVLVTLETLDDDAKPETGIVIPKLTTPPGESRKLAQMSDGDVTTWLTALAPGHAKADADAALTRFILQIDDEAWQKTDETTFDSVTSATRSQGVAYDGTGYVFSWTLGLQRTDGALSTTVNKPASIPLDMLLAKSNHIGDVDVFGGTLYAPVEDGNGYQHPTIVLFDAKTLDPKGPRFEISTSYLTKGVPWVAVDGPRNVAYVAEWDPTPAILVFDLATFTYQRSITLSKTLGRIQGGKVLDGTFYASSDDADKTLYKIDLDTGIVLPPLFSYTAAVVKELEGFAVVPGQGTTPAELRVLGVDASSSSVTFRTHTRTRAPLRNAICAP